MARILKNISATIIHAMDVSFFIIFWKFSHIRKNTQKNGKNDFTAVFGGIIIASLVGWASIKYGLATVADITKDLNKEIALLNAKVETLHNTVITHEGNQVVSNKLVTESVSA